MKLKTTLLWMGPVAFIAATMGSILEHRLELLDALGTHLSQPEPLQDLPLDSRSRLNAWQDSHRNGDPVRGGLTTWQSATRSRILELAGSNILTSPDEIVQFTVLNERQLPGGIMQRLIAFESFDGAQIPAYLHIPNASTEAPGILVIPGHVREGESGIEQLANEPDSYQHAAARRLAEAGFVTLTPELRGFGYAGWPDYAEHRIVAYNAILSGTSYKWISLRDLGFAMQLLRRLEQVDEARIGVTGASLGGELAVHYSALDQAVDAVVFQSFGGSAGIKGPQTGSASDQRHFCHVLPGIDRIVSQEHWVWLLAPRPALGIRGSQNRPFDDEDFSIYSRAWTYANEADAFALKSVAGGHEYFVEPAIVFFSNVFEQKSS